MKRRTEGMIMVTVMLLLPICVILAAVVLSNVIAEKHHLQYERARGRSFYLAETGLNAAYFALRTSNFENFTHVKENGAPEEVDGAVEILDPLTLPTSVGGKIPFTRASDGWYEYESDDETSLFNLGVRERIRFRVSSIYQPPASSSTTTTREAGWQIVCEATLGNVTRKHCLTGQMKGLTRYAIFDAGTLNEFWRGQNQTITGPVHANGDIFIKPSRGTTLTILSDEFTSGGNIWNGVDATGYDGGAWGNGTTKFGSQDQSNPGAYGDNYVSLATWSESLDHESSNWVSDAMSQFKGTVQDQAMGAGTIQPPTVESFEPDGFYYNKADANGLLISKDDSGTILVNGVRMESSPEFAEGKVKVVTFRNHAEERDVRAVVLDFDQDRESGGSPGANAKLSASDYPNGLIYSEVPLVLDNAKELPHDTSIVSQTSVYTRGDFNKELPVRDDYRKFKGSGPYASAGPDPNAIRKKSAAIMTKDRIWHVSKNFELSTSVDYQADPDEPEEYSEDDEYVNAAAGNGSKPAIEINSMLLDGQIIYDETFNRNSDGTIKYGTKAQTGWDDYLEYFDSGDVVKRRGSIVHLQNATMADIGASPNSITDEESAWYRDKAYHWPTRDYSFDPIWLSNLRRSRPGLRRGLPGSSWTNTF